jgi:hypothetical protein
MEGPGRKRIGGHSALLNGSPGKLNREVSAGTEGSVTAFGRVMSLLHTTHEAGDTSSLLLAAPLFLALNPMMRPALHTQTMPTRPRRD